MFVQNSGRRLHDIMAACASIAYGESSLSWTSSCFILIAAEMRGKLLERPMKLTCLLSFRLMNLKPSRKLSSSGSSSLTCVLAGGGGGE